MTGPAPSLDELYDPDVLAALDRSRETTPPRAGRSAAAALTAALLAGVASALEDCAPEPAIVEFEPDRRRARPEPVTVHLVPGVPRASVAVVRPWLLA